MSLYEDRIDELVGTASDRFDIRAVERPCYFYDIEGYPTYLWEGQFRLHAEDGRIFLGTIDANGVDHHVAPQTINDGRDGSSADYSFSFPYFDEATFEAVRTERWRVRGRTITRYMALFYTRAEGLRPSTPLDFDAVFTMQSAKCIASVEPAGETLVRRFQVTISAKDGNAGQSRSAPGTYSPTSQRHRAFEMYGIEDDAGCDFIPPLEKMTLLKP